MDSYRLPEVKSKLYGKYRGIVEVGLDPEKKGRIKVKVPSLFGYETLEHWAYPVLPAQFVGFDLDDGGLQLDIQELILHELAKHVVVGIPVVHPKWATHAWTIQANNDYASGHYTREKLPEIIGVDPKHWYVPKGTGVWVEFEGGDLDKPLWVGYWWK